MMPLLDVVFLLLTFFIYSFVVMIRADALSLGLSPVAGGGQAGTGSIELLLIDGQGGLVYGGERLEGAEVDRLLEELAADPARPQVYVSLAADGTADRGPVVWSLIQRAQALGLENLTMVGPPPEEASQSGGGQN